MRCLAFTASVVETGRGEEGGKWSLDSRPSKVYCMPLPGCLTTIPTFTLSVFPILRVNSNFLEEDLINKSMNKRRPEKFFSSL